MAEKTPDFLKENADGSVTITLSKALTVNGQDITVVTMREPLVRDQLAAAKVKGTEAEREVWFFGNLCEVDKEAIERLSVRDYGRLQAAYAVFTD